MKLSGNGNSITTGWCFRLLPTISQVLDGRIRTYDLKSSLTSCRRKLKSYFLRIRINTTSSKLSRSKGYVSSRSFKLHQIINFIIRNWSIWLEKIQLFINNWIRNFWSCIEGNVGWENTSCFESHKGWVMIKL